VPILIALQGIKRTTGRILTIIERKFFFARRPSSKQKKLFCDDSSPLHLKALKVPARRTSACARAQGLAISL
jgi:hypothetical protein